MDFQFLSLGAIFFLAIVGGIWKTATLRGDMFEKWNVRVELADASLSEKARGELLLLHTQITALLGSIVRSRERFDPSEVVADPGELLSTVIHFKRLIEKRDGLQGRFRLLLQLGPIFLWTLVALEIGVLFFFLHHGGILINTTFRLMGVYMGGASLLILLSCFVRYAFLQNSLSGAELLAKSEISSD